MEFFQNFGFFQKFGVFFEISKFLIFPFFLKNKDIIFLAENPEENLEKSPAFANFPLSLFKNPEELSLLHKKLEFLSKEPNCFEEEIDRETGLKKLNINKIFSLFLHKIARFLTKDAYIEICLFIIFFRKTLNSIENKDNFICNSKEIKENGEFCENNTGDSILQASNELITKFLPKFLEEFDKEKLVLIGVCEEKLKNVIYLTQFLGNWLFANYFTNLKLDINYE